MSTFAQYRWGDHDHRFGPFIYAHDNYSKLSFILGSGDDDHPGCRLRVSFGRHTFIVALPPVIQPWREKVFANSWDEATIARLGRNWYWNLDEREYGFSYSRGGGVGNGGFLQVFLGRQTHDSSTTKDWSCFTPWNNWRHVRHSYYGLNGEHVWTKPEVKWRALGKDDSLRVHRELYAKHEAMPTRSFQFLDFDGEAITAKTKIEEREWRLGTGWFKWLSWLKQPIIHRSLDIDFSGETGPKKGSWKGGTVGHSIEMLPNELHESAFRRYCALHNMTFKGAL
jgi:hypothetical protein